MRNSSALRAFYDRAYSHDDESSARYGAWRALGARGKAVHVTRLCARTGIRPARTLEIGCGDGALLCELARCGFGGELHGLEITRAAVEIASARPEIAAVSLYDGERLPAPDGAYDLGILSHVLEHVLDPAALLAEAHRACRAVLVEVPLEANLSARRPSKRGTSAEIGHIQRFDRAAVREAVAGGGMRVAAELQDALPLRVQLFGASTLPERAQAFARWAVRAGIGRVAPRLARRLFTVHYAALCLPRQ